MVHPVDAYFLKPVIRPDTIIITLSHGNCDGPLVGVSTRRRDSSPEGRLPATYKPTPELNLGEFIHTLFRTMRNRNVFKNTAWALFVDSLSLKSVKSKKKKMCK